MHSFYIFNVSIPNQILILITSKPKTNVGTPIWAHKREFSFATTGTQRLQASIPHILRDWYISSPTTCWVLHANPSRISFYYHLHNV